MNTTQRLWLSLAAGLLLGACGARPLQTADDAGSQPPTLEDPECDEDVPGACVDDGDCPSGQRCTGCGYHPCTPELNVCFPVCEPAPSDGCNGNQDCRADQYCRRTECGAAQGKCEQRGSFCIDSLPGGPACGCDGKTYLGGLCELSELGVNADKLGFCDLPNDCVALDQLYASYLAEAKRCTDFANFCTVQLPSKIGCGSCPTYVESSHVELIQQLELILQRANSLQCGINSPCAPPPCGGPRTQAPSCSLSAGGPVCTP